MHNSLSEPSNISIDEIFSQNKKFTFVVGAGISISSPTCLHSAHKLIHGFFDLMIPSDERSQINDLQSLRFEKIIEFVQNYLDKDLSFLDDFDNREPNLIHHFLATAIMQGHHVITTNFDCMIEKALAHNVDEIASIVPVITREDFKKYFDPDKEINSNKYPVYKIHGSKINYVTNLSTKESLVTTISALGKEGENKTFSIAPYKKPAFNKLINERTLIMMGYSGSDEFDIKPSLIESQGISSVIWITHADKTKCCDAKIKVFTKDELLKKNIQFNTPSEKLFFELLSEAKKWDRDLKVYDIQVDTSLFIEEYLFTKLVTSEELLTGIKNKLEKDKEQAKPYVIKLRSIPENVKYDVACWIYSDLNETKSTYRCAQKGFALSKKDNDKQNQIVFLKWLGMLSRFDKKYYRANVYFKKAIKISKKINDIERSLILNEIGRNYEHQNKYIRALKYYKRALGETAGNDKNKVIFLNNIAKIHCEMRQFKTALSEFEEIFDITQKMDDFVGMAFLKLNIANVKFNLAKSRKEREEAIQDCEEAIGYTSKVGDFFLKAMVLTKQAHMYGLLEMYKTSQNKLEEVLKIYKLINYPEGIAETFFNIGEALAKQDDLKGAIERQKEALDIFEKLEKESKQAEMHHHIAGNYFFMKDPKNAFQHEQSAVKIAEKLNIPEKKIYKHYLNIIKNSE